jgi:hypothetical protein
MLTQAWKSIAAVLNRPSISDKGILFETLFIPRKTATVCRKQPQARRYCHNTEAPPRTGTAEPVPDQGPLDGHQHRPPQTQSLLPCSPPAASLRPPLGAPRDDLQVDNSLPEPRQAQI